MNLPERCFLVAVEGEWIVGAVLDYEILYPFLTLIDGQYKRVKVNKNTLQNVAISKNSRLNRRFLQKYWFKSNLFYAEPLHIHIGIHRSLRDSNRSLNLRAH